MLPQINRIKKKKDFAVIFKDSRSFKNTLFILRIRKNSLGVNRIGFVVSQKVSKKATLRNKVRRRLSDIMKEELAKIKIGTDLVFIALHGIEKKDFLEIKETVTFALYKAGLISK